MAAVDASEITAQPPSPARAAVGRAAVARRSRMVAALKLLLPAAALTVVAVVLAWPDLAPEDRKLRLADAAQTPQVIDQLKMSHPRYVGEDEKGRPFVVTGLEAIQDSPKAPEVRLTAPKADLTQLNDAWVIVSAERGVYHRPQHQLVLDGSVAVFQDDGTELHTEHADIDLKAGSAQGDVPVRGQGPAGSLTGEGFELRERGRWILLKGKSTVILRETSGPAKPAAAATTTASPTPTPPVATATGAAKKPAAVKTTDGKKSDPKKSDAAKAKAQ